LSVLLLFVSVVASSNVVDLTPDNFYEVVDGSKNTLVEFYAPWCGHCKHLAPEYEILADAFKGESSVTIAKVDADAHRDIGGAFGVTGFPTIKFFAKGSSAKDSKGEDYSGGRTADDMINFINGKAGTRAFVKKAPSSVVVLTTANFDEIVLNENNNVLVEFYAPWCGHCKSLAPVYEQLGKAYVAEKDVVIAKVDCDAEPSLATRFGVSGFPTLKFFAKGAKADPLTYESGRDINSFVTFINEKTGSQRTSDGSLSADAGRIASLDALVTKFVSSKSASVIAEAEAEAKTQTGVNKAAADIYVKLMRAFEKKGASFVESETSRVSRMLEGSLTAEKRDELQLRKNILAAFN